MPISGGALLKSDRPATLRGAGEAGGADVAIAPAVPYLWRFGAWAAASLLALMLMAQWGQGTGVHNDFTQNVWLPARLVLDGANPYDPTRAEVDAALGVHAAEFSGFNGGPEYFFIYPLWVALAFAPLAALPLTTALAVWRAAMLLLLVWSVSHLLRSTNPVFKARGLGVWAALGLTTLLALIYRESVLTLYLGQFSIIELAILAGMWGYLLRSGGAGGATRPRLLHEVLFGAGLAMLATKPQAVGLAVVLLGAWAIRRRRWLVPASATGWLALLLLAPLLFYPGSLSGWLGVVTGGQATSQAAVSASAWGVSYHLLGPDLPWVPVATGLSLLGLAALIPWWRRDLLDRASPAPACLGFTLCINSLISPYMLGYEHVLLLVPGVLILAAAGLPGGQNGGEGRRWRAALHVWLAALPFMVVALQIAFGGKEWPVVVQSLAMLALLCLARPRWHGERLVVGGVLPPAGDGRHPHRLDFSPGRREE